MKPILESFQNRSFERNMGKKYPTISMLGIPIDIPVPE